MLQNRFQSQQTLVFCMYLGNGTSIRCKKSAEKRTSNAVRPVLNPDNTCYNPYLGNCIFDRCKITSRGLTKERWMPYNWFQSRQTHVNDRILAKVHPIDTKNLQSAKKRTGNVVKLVSKPANTHFWPYLDKGTSNRRKKPSKVKKKERRMP